MKILLAVDGSKESLDAIQYVIDHSDWLRDKPTIELVTVQPPLPQLPGLKSLGKETIHRYYQEEGEKRLVEAKQKFDAAGVAYEARVLVGHVAETLVKHAKSAGCDLICMGSRGLGGVAGALVGSTATKVLHFSEVPVLVVK
jgi:nucleotide-binding universal stress UspA family protein